MRKISRKILGYLLSVAMVMSSLSLPAFASEIDKDTTDIENEAEAEIASEFVDEDAEEVIVEDADEETAEEIIPEDVEDEEEFAEEVVNADAEVYITFTLNGVDQNKTGLYFENDTDVDEDWKINNPNEDLSFRLADKCIPDDYEIYKLYYTVGDSSEEKNPEKIDVGFDIYTIPKEDIATGNISVFLVAREIDLGKISFTLDGETSDALDFAKDVVYEDWYLYKNAGDIKFKLTANLLGRVIKTFTYQPDGAEEPVAFGAPDEDGFYTIPADANTGVDIAVELVTEEFSEPICGITFTVDGEVYAKNLVFTGDVVDDDWKVTSAEDIVFSVESGAFKIRYGVDTITYQVGSGEVVDLEDVDGVYTIPATALTGEDIVIALTTKIVNPICTKYELSGVGEDNVITLPVGTEKAFEVVKEPYESLDNVVPVLSDDANGFNVGWGWDGFCVVIFDVPAEEVKGSFSFVNRSVEDEKGEYPVLSTYTIKGKNPEWTGKKVSASVTSTTDVAINVNIKPVASISEDLSSGKYFYKVELVGTPDLSNTELELNSDLVEYYIAGEDELNISIVPFWKETEFGLVPANLGEGIAANFKVEVTLVQRKNSVDIPESDEDVFLSSQKLVLSTATKAPHYAEKISIKKGQTTLYEGEGSADAPIKGGTVTFGKNDTYVTKADWEIRSVIAPNGYAYGTVSNPFEEDSFDSNSSPLGYIDNPDDDPDFVYGGGLYIAKPSFYEDINDNGIYLYSGIDALPGKYTIVVATKGGNGQTPEAKITITVKSSIHKIELSGPKMIYKNGNKKVTAKTSVSAYSNIYNNSLAFGYRPELAFVKNPKVTYKVGLYDGYTHNIENVDGISIDKKGVISIDKNYTVTEENRNYVYAVIAQAADYSSNATNAVCKFTIANTAYKLGKVELYSKNSDETYSLLNSNSVIPIDEFLIYIAVKDKKGDYILGGDGKGTNDEPIVPVADVLLEKGLIGDLSTNKMPTAPCKLSYSVKSIDGSKAKASLKVGYRSDSNDFTRLVLSANGSSERDKQFITCVPIEGEDAYTCTIPSIYGRNSGICLSLAHKDIANSDFKDENYFDLFANQNCFVSGTISVEGAKVIMDMADEAAFSSPDMSVPRKQTIYITPNKSTFKVIVKKPIIDENGKTKTVTTKYTIKIENDEKVIAVAPKISSVMIGTTDSEGQVTYTKPAKGREYSKNDFLEFRLKKPLDLPEGVNVEDVNVILSSEIDGKLMGYPIKSAPFIMDRGISSLKLSYNEDASGSTACVRMKCDSILKEIFVNSKMNITLDYYYLKKTDLESYDKVYLTKNSSSCVIKFTNYKKSFKANASQTLKFTGASGDTPATVTADFIKGKGKNVKSVTLKEVYNCNIKGTYNDFDQFFEVKDGKLSVKESKLEVLNAEALKAKKKVPASKTGYVNYLVTYTDGSTQEILSKVTVKFAK